MPVRQRGESFQADVTWGGKRVRKGGFASRSLAEKWERDTEDKLRRGIVSDPKAAASAPTVATLKQLLDKTYDQFWSGAKAEETQLGNGQIVVDILGPDADPRSIGDNEVEHLIGVLKSRNLSGGTINRKTSALRRMLRYAHQRGWIDRVPYIPRQRESEHRLRWLTDQEEQDVLHWFRHLGWVEMVDVVTLLIDSGLRISEALALEWRDVTDGYVRVWVSKNGRPRSIPQTDRVAAMLQRRRNEADGRLTVFTLNRHQADKQWAVVREKMGLADDDQFVIHALRHTTASRLVQKGVDLPSVQQLMGHTTITTTLRYAHLAPQNLVNAVSALQGRPLTQGQPVLRLVGGDASTDKDRERPPVRSQAQ